MTVVASLLEIAVPYRWAGVLAAVFLAATAAAVGLWVARDASARGSDQPTTWAFAAAFTPIGLPYYWYLRLRGDGIGERERPPTRSQRALGTWMSASLVAVLTSMTLAPPDAYAQFSYVFGMFVVALPVSYVLVYRGGIRRAAARVGA